MEKLDIRNKADIATDLPLISIIGRPNAGKSTLFNRLIGKRRAITDPTPGVTRDPIPERWLLGNNAVTLVDSGGVKLDKEGIDYAVTDKSLSLLEQSDAVCIWHPNVQQNQVVLILQHKDASRFGAVGCVDGMAFISENVREHFSDTKFVIDDKDF